MSIRYREKYKTWQVYWNNPLTKKRESLTFKDEKEARKQNSLINHRLQFEPESFRREEEPEPVKVTTLSDVYLEYLKEKQFSKKELSSHLALMHLCLDQLGEKEIAAITQDDLQAVVKAYTAHYRHATASNALRIVRTVVYYAMSKKLLPEARFPKIPSPQYQQFVPPTPEELAAIYEAAVPHVKRVIVIGAYLGVRIGACELFQLTWEDVDLTQGLLRVHGSRKNKNATWREVPIRESLLETFRLWKAEDDAAGQKHLISFRGKPVLSIKHAWADTLKRAGITRRIRPYDLRHAFGTELVAAGVDVGTVAKLMGHSSPTMLLTHYQYVMDAQKRKAVELLPEAAYVPQPMCRENLKEGLH